MLRHIICFSRNEKQKIKDANCTAVNTYTNIRKWLILNEFWKKFPSLFHNMNKFTKDYKQRRKLTEKKFSCSPLVILTVGKKLWDNIRIYWKMKPRRVICTVKSTIFCWLRRTIAAFADKNSLTAYFPKQNSFPSDSSFAEIFFNADFRPNFTSFALALKKVLRIFQKNKK